MSACGQSNSGACGTSCGACSDSSSGPTSWSLVRLFAGLFILLSLALGIEGSPMFMSKNFLWFTAFVGANLLQSAFTSWCPLEIILRKFGVKGGC